jgi:hypothetical protein
MSTDENAESNPEIAISRRIDSVCGDLTAGRVVPKDVDRLADAVSRTRMNNSLGRAIGGGNGGGNYQPT